MIQEIKKEVTEEVKICDLCEEEENVYNRFLSGKWNLRTAKSATWEVHEKCLDRLLKDNRGKYKA